MYVWMCILYIIHMYIIQVLLRELFDYYSNDDNRSQMSAGKFYKMVRECRLMDALVTQDHVGSLYKQVLFLWFFYFFYSEIFLQDGSWVPAHGRSCGLFYLFWIVNVCAGDENRQGGGHIYRVPRLHRGSRQVGPDQVRSLRRAHSAFQPSCQSRTRTQGINKLNRNLKLKIKFDHCDGPFSFSTVLSITSSCTRYEQTKPKPRPKDQVGQSRTLTQGINKLNWNLKLKSKVYRVHYAYSSHDAHRDNLVA